LAADKAGLPELKRVIVAFGDEVVMEENLELALQRLFGSRKGGVPALAAAPGAAAAGAPGAAGAIPAGPQGAPSALAKEAISIYERAVNLQRQGDWSGYGEELRKLEQVLRRMAQ
jgi:uncharacterized membrane protein (UPF0182 family)